jgi:hypothetical protein
MAQSKVEVGQCYEDDDHVYMVMYQTKAEGFWNIQDTTTKEEFIIETADLVKYRRPFPNWG